jgi:glycosyltransferase involved in cell wall biosynthesis
MKVLSIGRDKDGKIFDKNNAVGNRNVSYGRLMQSLDIIVFTLKSQAFNKTSLSENVTIYPTNSSSRWFFVLDAISLGKKIIKENKFVRGDSVVTCQDPFECGFIGWRIARYFRLPLHLQIHTDFLSPYFKTSFFQRFRVFVAKFLIPRADFVRVVSLRIALSLKKSGLKLKHPARVLPIRIDVESIINNSSEKISESSDLKKLFPQFKFIILMASRLTKEKCIDDALSAFADIAQSHPYVGLVVAGDGPLIDQLKNMAKNLGISEKVIFLGFRGDVFSLMKSANMFLSTSEYEGYGMSLVEAGLSRLPVLSTDAGISGEILVHLKNSYICPVGNISCIKEGIKTLISDNSLRLILSQNLSADINSYIPNKEEYVKSYVALLEEAAHNNIKND